MQIVPGTTSPLGTRAASYTSLEPVASGRSGVIETPYESMYDAPSV